MLAAAVFCATSQKNVIFGPVIKLIDRAGLYLAGENMKFIAKHGAPAPRTPGQPV
jgi:hypothetical protein